MSTTSTPDGPRSRPGRGRGGNSRRGRYVVKSHFVERAGGTKREWYFSLVAGNGEIVGSGEGYTSRSDCLRGIRTHRRTALTATIDIDDDE